MRVNDSFAHVFATPVAGTYSTHISSDRHFGRHWHDTYGFGLLERGAHYSASGRGQVRAYAGDVITTNPGEVHDGRPLGAATRRWRIVYIAPDVMAALLADRHTLPAIAQPVFADRALVHLLRRLFRRIERWNRCRENRPAALACEESLAETCTALMARHGTAAGPTSVPALNLRHIREELADRLLDPPTLADLAATAGLSRYQLLRRFERSYGLPPHAWVVRERTERARTLIRRGMSLAGAALACGFCDQSHMTRAFVRQFGFTPGAWQKAAALQ